MKISNAKIVVLLVSISLGVYGCSDAKEDMFITKCSSDKSMTVDSCECLYGLANDSLEEKELDLFLAMASGDKEANARIQGSLGMMEAIKVNAKIAMILGKTMATCDVKL